MVLVFICVTCFNFLITLFVAIHLAQVERVIVHCMDLGMLTKLRVGHDNAGLNPGWFVDSIVVKNLVSSTSTTFRSKKQHCIKKRSEKLFFGGICFFDEIMMSFPSLLPVLFFVYLHDDDLL